jgi:hypothetical protein
MKRLAEAIILSAKLREESYNRESAEKDSESGDLIIDFSKHYKLSLSEAVDLAIDILDHDKKEALPIYLLLKNSWNDILQWTENL